MRSTPRAVGELMQVHCVELVRFVFGHVLWGGDRFEVPVQAGSVVLADRVQCGRIGGADFVVSSPAYVENPDGSVAAYEVKGEHLHEDVVATPQTRDTWEAWKGGVGTVDRSTS